MISTEKRSFVSIIVGILISSTVLKNLKVPRTLAMGVVAALVLAGMAGSAGALSNSGGGSWQYSKDITISNPGGALSDYQVLVNLTSNNFPTNALTSGADIRFTDAGGAELNYWIERWNYAGRSARVWVNVKSIPAGASSIRMWYGNPSAGNSSNGKRTFVFFDDFESYQLGERPTGWQFNTYGEYIVSTDYRYDGEKSLKLLASNWADSGMIHDSQPISNFVYQAKGYPTSSSYGQHGIIVCTTFLCNIPQEYWLEFTFSSSNTMHTRYVSTNHIDSSPSTTGYFNTNEWNTLEIRSFNGGIELYVNGNKAYEDQNFGVVEFDKFGLTVDTADSRSSYWDQLIVRKYAFPEPSVSVGAEQSIGPTTIPPTTVPPTTVPPTTVPPTTVPPKAVTTPGKFRVGPTVNLRPVTETIERNQDGIVELYMDNPALNDVKLTVEARITVPSGIHVYGQGFAMAGAAGVVMGQFEVPPGTARTISVNIKADDSARIGSHSIKFTGLYYPGENKDNYQPISLTYGVTVKAASAEIPKEGATPTPKGIPGFMGVLAIVSILGAAYLLSRK